MSFIAIRRASLAAWVMLILAGTATGAAAHAFQVRYDSPLPLWHYLTGAGLAVALFFVMVALAVQRGAAFPERRIAVPAAIVRAFSLALRTLGVVFFVVTVAAGLFGAQGDWDSNPLPVFVWVIWWVGLAFAGALIGGVWPLLDPWRTLGGLLPKTPAFAWPAWLDAWPAVLLFFGFACAELAWSENAVPRKLALLIVLYSTFAWIGMALFGGDTWRDKADPFARFFALFARFAPFAAERNDGGGADLILRPFGAGLTGDQPPTTAMTAFVILVLSTVSFDGIGETPFWESVVGILSGWLYATGLVHALGYTATDSIIKVFGLIATPLAFAAIYLGTCAGMARIVGESAGVMARRYVLTLVPIAVAYHLAHYLTYLLVQGQMIWPLLSDPFGLGWNLLGGRGFYLDATAVDAGFVWFSAVGAIVLGHVAAIWLAHHEALKSHDRRAALRAQLPMAILMIAYTMLSLWILSQPVIAH